ncbi:hypothetical protein NP493_381g02036 [Ridgeia piscesae]|uniref:Hemerythrin-like domain-containing protein n=1 Tax=Ridgeia piscesae TaxID=27915 RepID=A0AAD9L1T1_RIDPI|nr:hypothetical protein NP493_381g02036 [Ridgeia piscesae]
MPVCLYNVLSCRVVSCRVVSCRVVSCRVVSCRVVACRAVPCRAVPCRAVPCRAVPCRAVPCRAVPCCDCSNRFTTPLLCFSSEHLLDLFVFCCYVLQNDNIDAEHKTIFEAIYACSKNQSSAAHLDKLIKVLEDHFKNEEALMEKAEYPEFKNHRQIHNDFLAKLKTLKAPLDDAVIAWTKKWWVGHIKGIDFKYKGKL